MFIIAKKDQKTSHKIIIQKKKYNDIIPMNDRISLDVADVVNHYEKIKAAYNRIYYVSDGMMKIQINKQLFSLEKGDACFIEKGMIIELQGTFSVIVVSHPPLQI
jgi:mannose-6-phosphate isomerase class I